MSATFAEQAGQEYRSDFPIKDAVQKHFSHRANSTCGTYSMARCAPSARILYAGLNESRPYNGKSCEYALAHSFYDRAGDSGGAGRFASRLQASKPQRRIP